MNVNDRSIVLKTHSLESGIVKATSSKPNVMREPSIVLTPGICGGHARVANTRVPVWGLEAARREGCTQQELLQMYTSLSQRDLLAAWDYVELHGDEIDGLIQENKG